MIKAFLFLFVSLLILTSCEPSPFVQLNLNEWECTKSHIESHTSLMPIVSGKVTTFVPVTNTQVVCEIYERTNRN